MTSFIRNLLIASTLATGGMTSAALAQSETGSASETAPAEEQSRAQMLMGDLAPKLADLTDDVLYADIWERHRIENDPCEFSSAMIGQRINGGGITARGPKRDRRLPE